MLPTYVLSLLKLLKAFWGFNYHFRRYIVLDKRYNGGTVPKQPVRFIVFFTILTLSSLVTIYYTKLNQAL